MARWRGTTEERGLGAAHQADKKRLLAQMREGQPCPRCGQPMYRSQALDRDHVVDRARGGTDGMAVLSHASCNRRAGARAGNAERPERPRAGTPHDTICRMCGRAVHRAPRSCEICGAHYHPNHDGQRTCGRVCGVVLIKRNKAARGPVRRVPSSRVRYYACRYCGALGVSQQPCDVCPALACQLRGLRASRHTATSPASRAW
jgi:hypothetical protein